MAGVGNASSGSMTDQLTRQHRMTLDEAHLILNVKRGEEMDNVLKVMSFQLVIILSSELLSILPLSSHTPLLTFDSSPFCYHTSHSYSAISTTSTSSKPTLLQHYRQNRQLRHQEHEHQDSFILITSSLKSSGLVNG